DLTTTTAMLAKCFIDAKLNPAVHLGGEVEFLKGSVRNGKNIFISEACEYRKSFLTLKRDYAILLNMEADHLDYYKSIENLQNAFIKFGEKANVLITSYELNQICNFKNKKVITVSLYNKNANFYIKNLSLLNCGGHCFEVYKNGEFYYNFTLNVIGEFNVYNALCVIALCDDFNIDKSVIHKALITFSGVKRRFEHLGLLNNAQVIHDYAHHPTEINKVVLGFRSFYKGELVVVFQPHTYSRTKDLLKDFVTILSSTLIDTLIVLPTYPAREKQEQGLSGKQLLDEIKIHKKECYYMSFKKAEKFLKEKSYSNNIAILILGAGDVENFARNLTKKYNH
ncbi:MAG: UDP-N-acetylmuramate--L-alanine ligase, partial [Christensenellales bacterium]